MRQQAEQRRSPTVAAVLPVRVVRVLHTSSRTCHKARTVLKSPADGSIVRYMVPSSPVQCPLAAC